MSSPVELQGRLSDIGVFLRGYLDDIHSEDINYQDMIVIAGGFARRIYMLQHDLEILDTDFEGDIDIFATLESVVDGEPRHIRLNETNEEKVDDSDYLKELNNTTEGIMSSLRHYIENPSVKFDRYMAKKVNYRSELFNYIMTTERDVIHSRKSDVSEYLRSFKSFCITRADASLTTPIAKDIQVIVKNISDITSVVDSFDIDNAKFIIRYPFEVAEYVGDDSRVIEESIYHVNDINLRGNANIVKSMCRLEKYARYGFTFSPTVYDKVKKHVANTNIGIQSLMCHKGVIYA